MNGDAGLIGCLVERLTTRLPHRTGTPGQDLEHDDVAVITRATLIKISATSIEVVLEPLVSLLEELGRPYKTFASYPPHILLSEIYVLSLAADCCSAHWQALRNAGSNRIIGTSGPGNEEPGSLDDGLVTRIFDHFKLLLEPLPDNYVLPARTILDERSARAIFDARFGEPTSRVTSSNGSDDSRDTKAVGNSDVEDIESYIKAIVEFVTASSWAASFEYIRNVIYGIRATATVMAQAGTVPTLAMNEEERNSLVILRFISYMWVDGQKLGLVIQEFCSSFLHFRRAYQNTVAIIAPLLITRWIERYPGEFILLHNQHRKLDGGPDTLFDMTQTIADSAKRRSTLYPFQTALLMLVPDVFEVASNLRDAKTGGMAKKVAFLESLRKALRNKNDAAGYCLVSLLRAARHFDDDGDAAIVSYAMDVQDEVRDAVFRRYHPNSDGGLFDQDLTTTAFISLTHLNFEGYVESLTQSCLNTSAPQNFKIAIIQACSYFARQPNAEDYRRLFTEAAGYIQSRLKAMSAISADMYIGDRHSQRKASETSSSTTTVICNILNFLDASPETLFEAPPPNSSEAEQFYEEIFEAFVACLVTSNDIVRDLASGLAKKLLAPNGILSSLRKSKRLDSHSFGIKFWRLTSLVLMGLCERHVQHDDDTLLRSIHGYLESRLLLLSSVQELSMVSEDIPERTATSTKLETLFLISLCSADIETCQLVTSCIGLFNEECRILDSTVDGAKTANLLLRNSEIFSEIASPDFRFTGMMAFQKRIRSLLRRMKYPSVGILDAWKAAFDKWIYLSKDVSTAPVENVDEKRFSEWRNLSGFLASLGGICTAEQAYILEEPAASGLKWIDRLSSEHDEEPLLNRYLRLSTQLLECTNVRVRETTREVLSVDISPALYHPLFKALESELEVLFTGALEASGKGQDIEIIFAEQAASLLKSLVERLETPYELGAASSVHFSSLGLSFAKFLDGVADNVASLRVKFKICQLCESVSRKKEHLNLRDDVRKRNQLLEYIFSWIARPHSPPSEGSYTQLRQDETARVQRDLDKACLRCLAELTYRLPLQPGDGQNDVGTSELKSQMFRTYFNRFLSLLNHESSDSIRGDIMAPSSNRDEAGSTSELAITILSNLLSANIDVGLKYSLNIGYNENIEIRTAFVKVLYNILVQGTEFSNLSDKAVNEKYDELLELLTHDMNLAVAISTVCPSSEVEELTISMLNIFESRGLIFDLMEALIKQEIEETENESEILRRNCVATKLLSVYAKWKGANYLKATLQKVVERLMLTSKDLDLELDPARISSQEELEKNALQLQIVAKVFIDDICASSANIPTSFRKICSIISAAVTPRFQEAKYTAVGAFIFLRFFCPAIVAPEAENLVDVVPSKEMRRGLLLIAKVIQNLANNVLFGAKEPYMYPLNDFLTENIYRITTFLREISVPPTELDTPLVDGETFEFGSCVALHRFLYDHWDHVRQRLMSQERRDHVRSPNELARGRSPVLEPLRALITNLGPPPLAVTWNRPQVSMNSPLAYSRFQHFMLRNAFRSTDSFLTSRAIYDGGESRDGLSVICVILRHIDQDSIDYDTLLYCYLKIASRMWHKPFGLLIDATCYDGQNEPSDELFKKLELLSPNELSRQLSRIYIYNMNSTFRKCFRRVLRMATKSDLNILNPSNVDYQLFGNLHELQAHFHLSQLHLPKETISMVTDTRYTFQPVTRLSKTKGKIEVVVKVGGQFVQVTTVKKQEVHPSFRLSAVVNDIFRLADVDEAPTSITTEDDSAFGLRADNGKIVMYFQSAKKADVLQSIRGAKAKLGKDPRAMKPFDRLIRPQDVPGTLLNLALTNLAAPDSMLRVASYNLLGALCRAFKFKAASKFMCIKDVSVPLDPTQFIINVSKTLAQEEPQLTSDFLNEFFVGWESFSEEQKPLSLAYMAPWIPSLRTSLLTDESDSEKAREKIASIFRKLIDVIVTEPSLALASEYTVWPAIYKDEVLLDIFLDEIVKAAVAVGSYDEHSQALASIVTAIGTITLRGKIISRLRKALNRSSLRPTKFLPENAVWNEICILLQFCLSLSFDCGVQSQLYLPEIFHIVTMLSNTGTYDIRALVHRLLINSIHAACTSFKLEDTRLSKLRGTLEVLSEPRNEILSVPSVLARDGTSISTLQETGPALSVIEHLATLLFETCSVAAPSVDMANAWRSRWMSLVASTAFQNNPAIQPRAFTVMGCLAREEVDDDLLYQVLVALRNSVSRFGEDGGSDMLVAIVTSLSKMIAKLTSASRYGPQLFWLAMSLVRLVPGSLFNCTALFLEAVLANIGTTAELRNNKMAQYLLQGRAQLEEASLPLDDAYGVHFTGDRFHFAVCSCLARGLTDPITKAPALRVLSTFLEMTADSTADSSNNFTSEFHASPYLALIQARAITPEDLKECLWSAGINPVSVANLGPARSLCDLDGVKDKDLLLNTAIELVDFQVLDEAAQTHTLVWLNELASGRPAVILHLCPTIASFLDEILLHGQSAPTLGSAHALLQTLSSNSKFTSALESNGVLNEILEDMGFEGLWRSSSVAHFQDPDKQCSVLTEKLIEGRHYQLFQHHVTTWLDFERVAIPIITFLKQSRFYSFSTMRRSSRIAERTNSAAGIGSAAVESELIAEFEDAPPTPLQRIRAKKRTRVQRDAPDSDNAEEYIDEPNAVKAHTKRRKIAARPCNQNTNANARLHEQLFRKSDAASPMTHSLTAPCSLPSRVHCVGYHRPLLLDSQQGRASLLRWFDAVSSDREMPWRKAWIDPRAVGAADNDGEEAELQKQLERRAYEVWISEVMLQQTRVAVVIDYWNRWMARWPTIRDLAVATPDEVLVAWRGLGYYSRATRIHQAAKLVCADPEMRGLLPSTVDELASRVPGVGRYTAGAISAIVFGRAAPMVDGNVLRVLSRQLGLFGDVKADKAVVDLLWAAADCLVKAVAKDPGDGDIDRDALSSDDDKEDQQLSNRPGRWGQALMELGSTICTPKPNCAACPITVSCRAYSEGLQLAAKRGLVPKQLTMNGAITDIEDACTLCKPFKEFAEEDNEELDAQNSDENEPPKSKSRSRTQVTLQSFAFTQTSRSKKAPNKSASPAPSAIAVKVIANHARKFPAKTIKKLVREEEILICAIRRSADGRYLIHRRARKGLLASLWELPSGVLSGSEDNSTPQTRKLDAERYVSTLVVEARHKGLRHAGELGCVPWLFSHLRLRMHVHLFELEGADGTEENGTGARSRWSDPAAIDEESMGTGMRKCWTLVKEAGET
ncbi:Ras GTPase activating protein ira2 [Parahypoxylon ruwenzoriense]